jgi:5-formyltetrahydrofolate cyclo-ligase
MEQETQAKSGIRQRMRDLLATLTPQQRHAASIATCSLLMQTPEFQEAHVVMIYLAMATEIDTAPIALRCWQTGKQVVVPRIYWSDYTLLPVEITSLTTNIRQDRFGLRQPEAGQPVPVEFIDLVLVPALAVGPQGQRIGRGHGFYDRFLIQDRFHGKSCGLILESQLADEIPMLPHDVPLDMLATDHAVRHFTHSLASHQ